MPTIVVGGFLVDATEQLEYQRSLLKEYGSVYYLNFPRNGFSSELFFAQLADLIDDINSRDQRPVLFGVSFGCGLIARFFNECPDARLLRVRGVVMVSPVLCMEDLVRVPHRKKGGAMGGERLLRSMLDAGAGNGEVLRRMERLRRRFRAAISSRAGEGDRSGRAVSLKNRILQVLDNTPAAAGYQRVLALKESTRPGASGPVFAGPALVLLAEQEGRQFAPGSPTLALLNGRAGKRALFPQGRVWTVCSHLPNSPVTHASLLSHHNSFNPLIGSWYRKLLLPSLTRAA